MVCKNGKDELGDAAMLEDLTGISDITSAFHRNASSSIGDSESPTAAEGAKTLQALQHTPPHSPNPNGMSPNESVSPHLSPNSDSNSKSAPLIDVSERYYYLHVYIYIYIYICISYG
jgi:hypothetical protein